MTTRPQLKEASIYDFGHEFLVVCLAVHGRRMCVTVERLRRRGLCLLVGSAATSRGDSKPVRPFFSHGRRQPLIVRTSSSTLQSIGTSTCLSGYRLHAVVTRSGSTTPSTWRLSRITFVPLYVSAGHTVTVTTAR